MTEFHDRLRAIGPRPSWQITATHEDTHHELLVHPAAPPPPGSHHLTNHGGSTIPNPKLFLIYLGPFWADQHTTEQFAKELMENGYLAPLAPYGTGVGTYLGSYQDSPIAASGATVTDAQLQARLTALVVHGSVPQPDGHTLYALLLPDGVKVSLSGQSSCSAFCGYHDAIDARTPYAVHPAPSCFPCHGTVTPWQAFCMVLAHEVGEACTDAVPGKGWYEDSTGMENGDICAWNAVPYGPWTVQPLWTNEQGCTVGTYTPNTPPPPPPPPPSTGWKAKLAAAGDALIAAGQALKDAAGGAP